ncbi:MAG: hypothetical protein CMP05_06930 [Xanthomarina sp.]|jgi:hypothetical protein|uniref:hypothetical protein n=1 Tax=Xanthomarina TaxID=1868329 RepID=UPI000C541572|nr:hypothetical protein [Xanthomarina sp.]MAL23101.1 hypothetical protein [Xanthomarina sp.]MBF61718.1 hypothetical protein [Xanthomarina sp.]HAB26639.1 hypothetical protein [Xanthomarina gelatinilytica]HAI20071.1 hypothetical protein [Xanthomarina gelatinilytica]|tara:strand:- start:1006 stop:1191 length:186 start_codon:yes stop_codon:yes gene_type:complete
MSRKTGAIGVLIAGILLLIMNFLELDFNHLEKGPLAGILSNVLLIIAMILSIRHLNNEEQT